MEDKDMTKGPSKNVGQSQENASDAAFTQLAQDMADAINESEKKDGYVY